MTTAIALHANAAEALVAQLPTPVPLRATAQPGGGPTGDAAGSAVVASFVGGVSADLAVVLTDLQSIAAAAGTDSPLVSVADVLRPALESAVGQLGAGVLGETRLDDARALFADPDTAVFVLASAGQPAGWFGIRVRENGTIGGTAQRAPLSVAGKLGRISNVEMALTVEIGRTRMAVRDVLGLEPGAVIELDRSAGAPADVLLNGRLIAHGEVVVVDQDYAVRITQILDIAEGIN
jgi:flagellar motor switch protein FliN/FliY